MFATDYEFKTNLQLSLTAPKGVIDAFLQKHPDVLEDDLSNRVAVIARVDSVTRDEKVRGGVADGDGTGEVEGIAIKPG